MEALRVRLRRELQEAYGDWLSASELAALCPGRAADRVDISDCPYPLKSNWLACLQAASRLAEAHAETKIRT